LEGGSCCPKKQRKAAELVAGQRVHVIWAGGVLPADVQSAAALDVIARARRDVARSILRGQVLYG